VHDPRTNDGYPRPEAGQENARVTLLEGETVYPAQPARRPGAPGQGPPLGLVQGHTESLYFDADLLSKHVLFLGGIGTGKTNAMMQLVSTLRREAGPDDVFVIFDTKGDFLADFYRTGDAVLASEPDGVPGGVIWNLFRDLLGHDLAGRRDEIYEIASTVFSEQMSQASDNYFFAAAARDIFAAVAECLSYEGARSSNKDLRENLEKPLDEILEMLLEHPDLAGTARYLEGDRTPESVLAFLQQTLNKSFSGVFRTAGDFSVRQFVRAKRARALFIEYDIARGSRLSPIYRILMDLAIKEALGLGRQRAQGSVFFVLDEFALLPELSHISEGINFGRSLGLKFLVGTQNVNQVLHAYPGGTGESILSGFGTVFAFRLMDGTSRQLVRDRFGANRKQIRTFDAVRAQGVHQLVVEGNVVEDWMLSGLGRGQCIVALPEGPPFTFQFRKFTSVADRYGPRA
jgi:type IV secretory pathway TraG/TraD family ATPase VirD4